MFWFPQVEIVRLRSSSGSSEKRRRNSEGLIEELYICRNHAIISTLPAGIIQRKYTSTQPIRNVGLTFFFYFLHQFTPVLLWYLTTMTSHGAQVFLSIYCWLVICCYRTSTHTVWVYHIHSYFSVLIMPYIFPQGFWYSFSSEVPETCPRPSQSAPRLEAVCLLTKDTLQVIFGCLVFLW